MADNETIENTARLHILKQQEMLRDVQTPVVDGRTFHLQGERALGLNDSSDTEQIDLIFKSFEPVQKKASDRTATNNPEAVTPDKRAQKDINDHNNREAAENETAREVAETEKTKVKNDRPLSITNYLYNAAVGPLLAIKDAVVNHPVATIGGAVGTLAACAGIVALGVPAAAVATGLTAIGGAFGLWSLGKAAYTAVKYDRGEVGVDEMEASGKDLGDAVLGFLPMLRVAKTFLAARFQGAASLVNSSVKSEKVLLKAGVINELQQSVKEAAIAAEAGNVVKTTELVNSATEAERTLALGARQLKHNQKVQENAQKAANHLRDLHHHHNAAVKVEFNNLKEVAEKVVAGKDSAAEYAHLKSLEKSILDISEETASVPLWGELRIKQSSELLQEARLKFYENSLDFLKKLESEIADKVKGLSVDGSQKTDFKNLDKYLNENLKIVEHVKDKAKEKGFGDLVKRMTKLLNDSITQYKELP